MATSEQIDDLQRTFNSLDCLDYFSLLGIARDAPEDHNREGFHEFALKYHPDEWADDPTRRAQALRIFKRGTEAYRVLTHPVLRARYELALLRGELRLQPDEMYYGEETAVNDDKYPLPAAAVPLYDKAVACLEKRDTSGATMYLTLAKTHGDAPQFDVLAEQIEIEIRRNKNRPAAQP